MSTKNRVSNLERRVNELTELLREDTVVRDVYNTADDGQELTCSEVDVATIRGEVHAILDYLGIKLEVKQSAKVQRPAKVVVKKKTVSVTKTESVKKRKYVKSGKYSKKAKQ